jgi:hypothetical protein
VKSPINYRRGTIHILNREGLEAIASDCYPIIKSLYVNLYPRTPLQLTARSLEDQALRATT